MFDREFGNEEVKQLVDLIKQALAEEFEAQGHKLTGKTIASITQQIQKSDIELIIEFYGSGVNAIVNKGVSADRIPFQRGSGAGSSLYIDALTEYAKKRMGAYGKEARSIAFAIAQTHKKEGMPTRGSYRFSSTGERLAFVDIALDKKASEVAILAQRIYSQYVNTALDNFINAHKNGSNS
jgi:hypothetical protein